MVEITPQQKLPKTLALIRAATAQPTDDHTDAWNSAKEELNDFQHYLRRREDHHLDNKVQTLKKWEAKAGMLEKKRMVALGSSAAEHEEMFAAGVPAHVMQQFRQEKALLEKKKRCLQEKVQELKALGVKSVHRKWILPWKEDDAEKEQKE